MSTRSLIVFVRFKGAGCYPVSAAADSARRSLLALFDLRIPLLTKLTISSGANVFARLQTCPKWENATGRDRHLAARLGAATYSWRLCLA